MKKILLIALLPLLLLLSCEKEKEEDNNDDNGTTGAGTDYSFSSIYDGETIYDIDFYNETTYFAGLTNGYYFGDDLDYDLSDLQRVNVVEKIINTENEIWLATNDGLKRIRRNDVNIGYGFPHVFDIALLDDDFLYYTTKEGLFKFDKNAQTPPFSESITLPDLTQYVEAPYSVSDAFPFRVFIDSQERIWLIYMSGGVLMNDGTYWQHFHNGNSGLRSNAIRSIIESEDGTIYIGQWQGGLAKYENGELQAVDINERNDFSVWAMEFDKDGNLLVGTWNGFYVLNPREDAWDFYNGIEQFGFGYKVRTFETDPDGIIWMGLESRGIIRINVN